MDREKTDQKTLLLFLSLVLHDLENNPEEKSTGPGQLTAAIHQAEKA